MKTLLADLAAKSGPEGNISPNKQIAYDLGISARTIENYRANLMLKMQAATLSDLVRMALIAGILGTKVDEASGGTA
jgi:regulatory LuxR family protein